MNCSKQEVGKGNKIQFWSDPWCGNTNLQSRFPLVYALSKEKHMLIEKAFDKSNGRGWNIVLNKNLNDWEVVEF